MKVVLFLVFVVLFIGTTITGCSAIYVDYKTDVAMSNLQLADDASTPEQKSKFLSAFIAEMDRSRLPSHAAWIFTSPRNEIANQRIVLQSLVTRCDDLSKLDKASMGYSQGITQISGQEFDHALGQIQGIYRKAYEMSFGWWATNGVMLFLVPMILSGIVFFVAVSN